MKNLSFSLLIATILGVLTVAGQAPPPPVVSTGYLYESPDGGFRITLPAKPAVQVSPLDSSFGKSQVTAVTLSTTFASYSLVFLDFPTVMDDRFDINLRLDAVRDSEAKRLSARVLKDTEYLFGSYYGRENVFESASNTSTSRTFFAGPRLFSLTVVTRGKLSTQSETLRRSNQSRIDKFFDSFYLAKVPDAKQAVVELPKDFQVTFEKGRFSSKFLGLSMMAPANWIALNPEESATVMELGKEAVKKKDENLAVRLEEKNARALSMFSSSPIDQDVPDAILILMAEKAPYPNFIPSAVAKTYLKILLDPGETVSVQPTSATLGGIEFSWIETYTASTKLYHRMYFANVKGISFEISMTYRDPANLKVMLRAAETLAKDGM